MKVAALLTTLFLLVSLPALAQDHGEVGIYGEYLRFSPASDVNLGGLGARLSLNATRIFKFEAEMGYNFQQTFPERYSNGVSFTTVQSNIRVLDGLFGPTLQTNVGPVRAFVTAKGGFVNTAFSSRSPVPGFVSQIDALRKSNVDGAFYPGGGIEGFLGPIGLRLDAGDEMIFAGNGPYHNLRITFGPTIRF